MSIRARIEDAIALYTAGRPEGSLLSVLVAVAATSRRRRPIRTPSIRNLGKKMGDCEAFEAFLAQEMVNICRVRELHVEFRGNMHRIEHILYKWLRCELAHAGGLPPDIAFDCDEQPGVMHIQAGGGGTFRLSQGWLDGLARAVVCAPENREEFGDPPEMPMPLYLPGFDVTIGHFESDAELIPDATSSGTTC